MTEGTVDLSEFTLLQEDKMAPPSDESAAMRQSKRGEKRVYCPLWRRRVRMTPRAVGVVDTENGSAGERKLVHYLMTFSHLPYHTLLISALTEIRVSGVIAFVVRSGGGVRDVPRSRGLRKLGPCRVVSCLSQKYPENRVPPRVARLRSTRVMRDEIAAVPRPCRAVRLIFDKETKSKCRCLLRLCYLSQGHSLSSPLHHVGCRYVIEVEHFWNGITQSLACISVASAVPFFSDP
jgi:hypothetical protein